jgi:4-amino-4-deoxy-L-arabinose transferase-like glycosyltransferase
LFVQQLQKHNRTSAQDAGAVDSPSAVSSVARSSVYALIFSVSLLINVWFNFFTVHVDCSRACDASEYLRDAGGLLNLVNACCHGSIGGASAGVTAGLGQTTTLQTAALIAASQSAGLVTTVQHTAGLPATVGAALSNLKELSQGGPIFPAFIAFCFAIAGTHSPAAAVLGQCILAALAAVFVALTASRAWDSRVGFTAGFIQAVYPGFIVNSGRLYSESFSVFLSCAIAWLVVRSIQRNSTAFEMFLLGVSLYSLQLTRSICLLVTVICAPFVLAGQRGKRLASVALITGGFLIVMLPWLFLQHAAVGKSSVFVNRVGQYNAFIGNNVASQGWLSFPYPDGRGIEKKTVIAVIDDAAKENCGRWAQLMLDKPVRLFKLSWNDFRMPIGPISPAVQNWFHQSLLILAALGVPLSMIGLFAPVSRIGISTAVTDSDTATSDPEPRNNITTYEREEKTRMRSRMFLLCTFLVAFANLFFITVPRYNLQFMPVIVMFAAAALVGIQRSSTSYPRSSAVLCVSIAMVLVFANTDLMPFVISAAGSVSTSVILCSSFKALSLLFVVVAVVRLLSLCSPQVKSARIAAIVLGLLLAPFTCLPLRAHGHPYEWSCPFDQPGQVIEQSVSVPLNSLPALRTKQPYLLIDANGIGAVASGCEIEINGIRVTGPVIPSIAAVQDYSQLRHIAAVQDDSLVRHIAAVNSRLSHNVAGSFYWEGEYIFDCMTTIMQKSPADIRQWFLVPVPSVVIEKLCATPMGAQAAQLNIRLRRTAPLEGAMVFGNYRRDAKKFEMPSLNKYSWEKAFYGVENAAGLTDSRFDTKSSITPVWSNADLSREPGTQSGAYSIRLLIPAKGDVIGAEKIGDATANISELSKEVSNLPSGNRGDILVCHVHFDRTNPSMKTRLLFNCGDGSRTLQYVSPWLPRTMPNGPCDYYAPIDPFAVPGRLTSVHLDHLGANGTKFALNANGAAAVPEASLSLWRVPAGLLSDGFEVL